MGQLAREIEGLKTIFFGEREYRVGPHLTYEYYVALNSEGPARDIYLEHKNILSSRDVLRYHLHEDEGIFLLQIKEDHSGRYGPFNMPVETEVASRNDQKAAIEYFIQKILEWPRNEHAPINLNALEVALRNALA